MVLCNRHLIKSRDMPTQPERAAYPNPKSDHLSFMSNDIETVVERLTESSIELYRVKYREGLEQVRSCLAVHLFNV